MFNGESRIADKFVVRLPDGVREKVAEIARTNHRSMNSEIVIALEKLIDDATHVPNSGPLAQSAAEIRILEAFRKLSSDKKLAALVILSSDK
jgi:hypothetical protein